MLGNDGACIQIVALYPLSLAVPTARIERCRSKIVLACLRARGLQLVGCNRQHDDKSALVDLMEF